jgi:RNA polymerase sigma factor (sigma-70 family)
VTTSPDTFKHAIHTLYEDHQPWLFQWLKRKMQCTEQAAEVTQDTYVRVLQTGHTPPNTEGRAHLVQIAKGLMIDRFRRSAVERAYLESRVNNAEFFHPSPEEEKLILEALIAVDTALSELNKRTRTVFLMSQLDGLTYSTIAQELGISFSTVRKDMFTALKACNKALDQTSATEWYA